jgi:hypothetical protein
MIYAIIFFEIHAAPYGFFLKICLALYLCIGATVAAIPGNSDGQDQLTAASIKIGNGMNNRTACIYGDLDRQFAARDHRRLFWPGRIDA